MYGNDIDIWTGWTMEIEQPIIFLGWLSRVRCLQDYQQIKWQLTSFGAGDSIFGRLKVFMSAASIIVEEFDARNTRQNVER